MHKQDRCLIFLRFPLFMTRNSSDRQANVNKECKRWTNWALNIETNSADQQINADLVKDMFHNGKTRKYERTQKRISCLL